MWVEVLISTALAVFTIMMAYLGVHVTLHPAQTPKTAFWYKAGFFLCALFTVLLVVCQGVRNTRNQRQFAVDLASAKGEASGSHTEATAARREASAAKIETEQLRRDLTAENARREQAQKDLAIAVTSSESRLSKQMSRTESVLNTNINTYKTDTTNAVSRLVRPGRSFTPAERDFLIGRLSALGPRNVAISTARGSQECLTFESAIEAVFNAARWKVVPPQELFFITKDGTGLGLVVKGAKDKDLTQDQTAVATAFKSIGMQMLPIIMPDAKDNPIEIYVGLQP